MSPWPCSSVVATMCPDQVCVVQARPALTRHGVRRIVESQQVASVAPDPQAPAWRAALDQLASVLPRRTRPTTSATAVLSNRFVCYALVPPRAELADAGERLAYARHRLAAVHGAAANAWDVRLAGQSPGAAAVVAAVERELLAGLDDVFRRAGMRLASVQPRLMAATNGMRRRVAPDAWIALAEPGHLCLALLQRGEWQRLRIARHGNGWREQLGVMLDRECFQDGACVLPEDVYVWHARERLDNLPQGGRWRFHAVDSQAGADPLASA